MSIGRIAARVAVVGFGTLAWLALSAGPSWAAKEPSENAKLCREYPGALFAENGSAFTSTKACAKYVVKDGQLGGVDAVAEPPAGGSFEETCTGFGLERSTILYHFCGAKYSNGDSTGQYGLAVDGTWSVSTNPPCTLVGGKVVSLQVLVADVEGSSVELEFPPPSGC
jgi:hypothetical protein